MPTKRKLAVLLIKDKQIIISHFYLINIHIFDYPDSRLSGLFTEVPMSPDNRGSTVLIFFLLARNPLFQAQKSNIRSSVKEKNNEKLFPWKLVIAQLVQLKKETEYICSK